MNNVCCGGSKTGRIFMAVFVVALTVYVVALAVNAVKANKYIGRDAAGQASITVSGSGDVSAKPDLAVMDFSVVSEGKTVAAATEDNNKKMNAIVDVAKSLGVAENDLQTTGYNISPRYDYVKQTNTAAPSAASGAGVASGVDISSLSSPYYPVGQRVLAGYDVTQTLTVKMRGDNMSKIGQIIQEVTAAGANQAGDLQFTLDNPDAVQAQAREKAIADATAKAQALAGQLKVKLVRITSYGENGYAPTYQMAYAKSASADSGMGSVPAPNIQTGENKVTANVSITYEIE